MIIFIFKKNKQTKKTCNLGLDNLDNLDLSLNSW